MKTVKKSVRAVAEIVLLFALVFCISACGQKDNNKPQIITVKADNWNDYLVLAQADTCYKIVNQTAVKETDQRFSSVSISVTEGERYLISFAVGSSGTYGVLMADGNYEVIEKLFVGKNAYSEYNSVQITVPEGVKYVYVNSHTPKEIEVKKHSLIDKNVQECNSLPKSLKIACINCGQYSYGDGITTPDYYKSQWEKMASETSADMLFLEDSTDNFSATVKTDEMLTLEGQSMYSAGGITSYLRCASAFKPETISIIPFKYSISGSTKTTARFYALRFTYFSGNKQVAIYALHLVAESHISNVQQQDGSSLSQKLRQLQFSSLIEDAKNYDESIFVGDFNAQRADEYDIFLSNGYTLTNCSQNYGTTATLRDIPADNIIVSSGIAVNSFSVKDNNSYYLNTDHCLLVSEISFK